MLQHTHTRLTDHSADCYRVQSPFFEDAKHFALASAFRHEEHALLRLAEHNFIGRHSALALWYVIELDLDANVAASPHLARGAGQTCGSHVLDADYCASLHGLETGFQQKFFQKGI